MNISSSMVPSQASQAANKENAPPCSPPATGADGLSPPTAAAQARRPASEARAIPPQMEEMLSAIKTNLTTRFARMPPHTIQRLAELLLRPREHYRFAGPYLRAIDRVISVSSTADVFPLVPVQRAAGHLPNGTGTLIGTGSSWNDLLDGDENLGGALLTPIPWLQNDAVDDMRSDVSRGTDMVNGTNRHDQADINSDDDDFGDDDDDEQAGSLRTGGAVTQGELLRQEQEAGIVPSNEPIGRHASTGLMRAASDDACFADGEDHPHPSGPCEVGVEDMGPQVPGDAPGRFDVDVALGRRAPHSPEPHGAGDASPSPPTAGATHLTTSAAAVASARPRPRSSSSPSQSTTSTTPPPTATAQASSPATEVDITVSNPATRLAGDDAGDDDVDQEDDRKTNINKDHDNDGDDQGERAIKNM